MDKNKLFFCMNSIAESLEFSEKTLNLKKTDGGYFGISHMVLLACVFDMLGNICLSFEEEKTGTGKRFKFIQNNYINEENYGFSGDEFYEIFYKIYRCGLVHGGSIEPSNFIIHNNTEDTIAFTKNKNRVEINIPALLAMAKKVFEQIKTKYKLNIQVPSFGNITGNSVDDQTIIE